MALFHYPEPVRKITPLNSPRNGLIASVLSVLWSERAIVGVIVVGGMGPYLISLEERGGGVIQMNLGGK